ncbi:MAG: hypothetical protein JRH06_02605 [Deltaproteobacteria bacterium]|nr:hypothetical protein [Deltaproteobacteria bacterium]MBW2136430.1 hypothetical protein [Deltaproteobacteria bacterium]
MKKGSLILLILYLSVFGFCGLTWADDFLGVPLIQGGRLVQKSDKQVEIKTPLTHDEVLAYYKEALKDLPDIKIRDWERATYIEDDGKEAWHSITISKQDERGTKVVITKDRWTWIIGTLVLRYIGVFVVLLFLLVGMSLSGAIISRLVKKSG